MIDSILNSIKKPLGLAEDYEAFDEDVIMHINSVFSTLWQIGASPSEAFMIESDEEKWSTFFGDVTQANMVKTYVYLKVRLLFDPPQTSFLLDSIQKQITEYEWRLNVMEILFNPNAYDGPEINNSVYLVDDTHDFPEGADPGDLAIDPVTGDVYQNR